LTPSKATLFQTALLKTLDGTARAKVVPAEFLLQQFLAMDEPLAVFHLSFGWEAPTTLTHRLKSKAVRRIGFDASFAWHTSLKLSVVSTGHR